MDIKKLNKLIDRAETLTLMAQRMRYDDECHYDVDWEQLNIIEVHVEGYNREIAMYQDRNKYAHLLDHGSNEELIEMSDILKRFGY